MQPKRSYHAGFGLFIVAATAVDIIALNRKGAAPVGFREALAWSLAWVLLAFVFCAALWLGLDASNGRAVAVPAELQKRALIIGVIGAIILRAVMILIGAWMIARFHWILYLFGAFLLATGVKMLIFAEHEPDLEKNPILRWMRGHLTISRHYLGERLWLRENGLRLFSPCSWWWC